MPKEPLSDVDAAIRAIRLRAMLDRKRFRHLGDPDEPAAGEVEASDERATAQDAPDDESAS